MCSRIGAILPVPRRSFTAAAVGKLLGENLKRERMTEDEVAEEMRQQQIASLDQVEWAILEPSGSISVIEQ